MNRRVVVLSFLLGTLFLWGAESAEHSIRQGTAKVLGEPDAKILPGVVVVKLRSAARPVVGVLQKSGGTFAAGMIKLGVRAVHPIVPVDTRLAKQSDLSDPIGISRIYIGDLDPMADPVDVAAALSRFPDVEYAEPKYIQQLNDVPDDPLAGSQTNVLSRLNAFNGWTIAKGSPSVVIADVDGGTDWRHEDLIGNVRVNPIEDINRNGVFDSGDNNGVDDDGNGFVDDVVGWNFSTNKNDPSGASTTPQSAAHGTATASHFGAVTNNGKGIAGTSWNCSLLPICVASATSDNDIAYGYEGIIYAYRNGAKVINCSWGGQGGGSRFQQDVIDAATAAGALVVAAGGNSGVDNDLSPHYPSSYQNVLSVGGLNSSDNAKAWFSNYGVSVPVYTPSVSILSAFIGGSYGDGGSGTSYSSSLASGLAGILKSAFPTWTPVQIAAQLKATADPVDSDNPSYAGRLGRGRLNLARALSETHPALNMIQSQVRTTKGDSILLPGDTLLFTAQVKNVLFSTATNIQFNVSTTHPWLPVVSGTYSLPSLAPGQTAVLPPLRLLVGSVTAIKRVVVRLDWTINGNERDAAVTRVMLLPVRPSWYLEGFAARAELFSVKAVSKQVVWAAGGDRRATSPVVLRSTDGGTTWGDVTGNLPPADLYCVTALDGNRAWVGSGAGKIFSTTNGGTSWAQQPYPGIQSTFINGVWMFPDGSGFAMGDPPSNGVFVVLRTTNFGATWAHLPQEPAGISSEAGWNNSFWWVDRDHGWFGSNNKRVWRTTDGGLTWSAGATGGTSSYGVAFANLTTGFAIHDNGFVARTTDGGASWASVTFPTGEQCFGVGVGPGTSSAWISTSLDIYRTRNSGSDWAAERLFPFNGAISHVSMLDTTIGWAVTSNGEILRFNPSKTVTSIEENETYSEPTGFALLQNYPNPFNPTTVVSWELPVVSSVRLVVYDLLGRQVAVLVNETFNAGRYTREFDASGLASGVYLYRLSAGNSVAVKRMLLVR